MADRGSGLHFGLVFRGGTLGSLPRDVLCSSPVSNLLKGVLQKGVHFFQNEKCIPDANLMYASPCQTCIMHLANDV